MSDLVKAQFFDRLGAEFAIEIADFKKGIIAVAAMVKFAMPGFMWLTVSTLQGCQESSESSASEEAQEATTKSWVIETFYESHCNYESSSKNYPLDTCFCPTFGSPCQILSKTGANTMTQKYFDSTDTSCQSATSTATIVTGTCSSSSNKKYDFAGDGPAAVLETFSTSTCDAGTSTGANFYLRLDACESRSKMVCADGKLKGYRYSSGPGCLGGGVAQQEVAAGECWGQLTGQGFLLKSGC
eukprot:s1597_g6.t1